MRLDYQRAPNVVRACPDEEAFRHMVGLFNKGEDLFSADAADVVRVTLDQRGAAYHVTIAVLGPDGTQRGASEEHTLRTCPEAAREAASTAFLVAAPFVFPAPSAPSSPPAPSPPPPPPPAPPPARRVFVQLGAGGGLVLGFSPSPSAGFGGLVGVRFVGSPSWSLSAEGRADLDTAGEVATLPDGSRTSPRAGFAGGSLAPCVHASWLFGCALATLGHVRTSAGSDTQPGDGEAFYFGLGGRAGVEIPIVALPARPAFAAQLAADGLLTVVRPGVLVDGAKLWEAPLAAGRFGAYLVTIF
jgi:hypothetical protein